jgi:hypothetical protein
VSGVTDREAVERGGEFQQAAVAASDRRNEGHCLEAVFAGWVVRVTGPNSSMTGTASPPCDSLNTQVFVSG